MFTEKWVCLVIRGYPPGGINLINQYYQMALFGIIAIITPNRGFPLTTGLHDALLPYFIKWVRLVKQRLSSQISVIRLQSSEKTPY